jgi:acetoin utilization protein AcuB
LDVVVVIKSLRNKNSIRTDVIITPVSTPRPYALERRVQPVRKVQKGELFEKKLNEALEEKSEQGSLARPLAESGLRRQQSALKAYSKSEAVPKKREPAIFARDVMSSPLKSISANAKIKEAMELMEVLKIRHLTIQEASSSSHGKVIAMLSEHDLPGLLFLKHADQKIIENILSQPVSAVMSKSLFSATPDTPVHEIAAVMLNERIHALPVLGTEQVPLGMITSTDLLEAIMTHAPLDLWI